MGVVTEKEKKPRRGSFAVVYRKSGERPRRKKKEKAWYRREEKGGVAVAEKRASPKKAAPGGGRMKGKPIKRRESIDVLRRMRENGKLQQKEGGGKSRRGETLSGTAGKDDGASGKKKEG